MSSWLFWLWACLAAWCFAVGAGQPMPADAMARPARPKTFDSPDDLRTYLNQLGQYYAVAGRPRFGKRTGFSPRLHLALDGLSSYRYPLSDPSELYELLFPQAD
ncbi:pro-neuropeptide Y-like [Cimex lectularius]|uniref:Neuropeptide F n=1 Tax=Cimex lectularius TaxID=79782 RepID=A0A8I6SBT8_CIMLE|nr:pro-neuropeptide Y-like [Cimex lectularius]